MIHFYCSLVNRRDAYIQKARSDLGGTSLGTWNWKGQYLRFHWRLNICVRLGRVLSSYELVESKPNPTQLYTYIQSSMEYQVLPFPIPSSKWCPLLNLILLFVCKHLSYWPDYNKNESYQKKTFLTILS